MESMPWPRPYWEKDKVRSRVALSDMYVKVSLTVDSPVNLR